MTSKQWQDLAIVCAGTAWSGMPMSERHIACRLTEWCPVLYVDPPISVLSARNADSKVHSELSVVEPRLVRLSPIVLPGSRRPVMVRLTEEIARRQIRRAVNRLCGRPVVRVLASDLPLFDSQSHERRVIYATDDMISGAALMGLAQSQIRRHEARLAKHADLVVAVSEPIAEKWRRMGCDVVVIPNGCDAERFAGTDSTPLPNDVRLPPPIVGFTGQVNDRIDISVMEAVADRGFSMLIVGPVSRNYDRARFDALLRRPNVQWVGAKPFDSIPSYLRAIHVGLTPYGDSPFNRASFPLKTLEYLAAGRAAVSADLPASRALDTCHVSLAKSPRDFAEAVGSRLQEPLSLALVGDRRAIAASHGWSVRARQFAHAVGLTT